MLEHYPRVVYALQHNVTKKIYVGATKDPVKRFFSHLSALERGDHWIPDFQSDYDTYGDDVHFYYLDMILDKSQAIKEFEWQVRLNTLDRETGYNYLDTIGYRHKRVSEVLARQTHIGQPTNILKNVKDVITEDTT